MLNSKIIRSLILAAGVLVMTGCASLGPQFEAVTAIPSGKALVYIYRPSKFAGSAVGFDIHHDDTVITHLSNGGYYPFITNPGEIELWAKTESRASVTLHLRAGETRYVKGGIGVGFFVGRPKLEVVGNSTGAREITACKLIPAKSSSN